jgi:uncharacterized delta-60 repeat protein
LLKRIACFLPYCYNKAMSKGETIKSALFLFFIFIFAASLPLHAQWARAYGGNGDDWANSIQQTVDQGYIVAGYTDSFGAGNMDFWILKLSFTGAVEWQRTYGGGGDEKALAIQQTSDEGYIVAGYTDSFGAGRKDMWVLKLSPSGDIEWQQTFGSSGDDEATAVRQMNDGGFIIAGSSNSWGAGERDFWIMKLNSSGSVVWQKIYSLNVNAYLGSIHPTEDGGYIIAGSFNIGHTDILVLKLNSEGLIEWRRYYGGVGDDWANSIRQTSDGGYLVAGYTDSFGAGSADFWVLKLTSPGDVEWERTYGRSQDDWANSVLQTGDGGYIVAGFTESFGAGLADFWVIKLTSSGSIEWETAYGGGGDDAAFSIQLASDGGYVAAGVTGSYGAPGLDFLVLKLYSDGEIDPDCALPIASSAVVSMSSSSSSTALVAIQDTLVPPQYTDITPQDSGAESYLICEDRPEISGTVRTEGDVGIEGVTIGFSGGEGEATTDVSGNYSHSVSYGWSGTATPSKAGYVFTPSSLSYTELISDQADEDYTGFIVHMISGFVRTDGGEGMEGVVITFDNGGGEATTASDGSYSHLVKEGWSGTATPSLACYTFTPPSLSYTGVTSDYPDQNYAGTFLTYVISGSILTSPTVTDVSGVVMSGLPGSPVTDAAGYYEATVDCGWSGAVTPTRDRTVFDPPARNYYNLSSNQSGQDYQAHRGWIISGVVRTEGGEGINGVTITFSNSGGTAATVMDGSYSHIIIEGWSGTATPWKEGYDFTPFSRDYTNLAADQTDQDYTGTIITYTLTINTPEDGTTQPEPGSYVYDYGTEVEVTALPDNRYKFSQWSGDVPAGQKFSNPVFIIMDSDKEISVAFDKKGLCFIATAAYGRPSHPHVRILRDFRDRYLVRSKPGRTLVSLYYRYSPAVADVINKHKPLKLAARIYLTPLVVLSFMALKLGPALFAAALVSVILCPAGIILFRRKKEKAKLANYNK